MKKSLGKNRLEHRKEAGSEKLKISLYDLIEAVSDEMKPGEDNLIPETIQHLFDSGQARFIDCSTDICS